MQIPEMAVTLFRIPSLLIGCCDIPSLDRDDVALPLMIGLQMHENKTIPASDAFQPLLFKISLP